MQGRRSRMLSTARTREGVSVLNESVELLQSEQRTRITKIEAIRNPKWESSLLDRHAEASDIVITVSRQGTED